MAAATIVLLLPWPIEIRSTKWYELFHHLHSQFPSEQFAVWVTRQVHSELDPSGHFICRQSFATMTHKFTRVNVAIVLESDKRQHRLPAIRVRDTHHARLLNRSVRD